MKTKLRVNYIKTDSILEGFLNVVKQSLMNDIVELESREAFDSYMRSLEQKFYQKANIPTAPYEDFPEFPPKPF
jgi:hypothetical protein